jgi:hypothetical protein
MVFVAVVPKTTALLTGTSLRRKHNVDQSGNSFTLKWLLKNILNWDDHFAAPTGWVNNTHSSKWEIRKNEITVCFITNIKHRMNKSERSSIEVHETRLVQNQIHMNYLLCHNHLPSKLHAR